MVSMIEGHSGTSWAEETIAVGKNTLSFLIEASRPSPFVTMVVCACGAGALPMSYIVKPHLTRSIATLLATRIVLNFVNSPVLIPFNTRTDEASARKSVFITVSCTKDCITS